MRRECLAVALLPSPGNELVILSAYGSGTVEVQSGEGVMSLRRAFRIAGAQTVLASDWKVSDKATSQLMVEFIRRWRSGERTALGWCPGSRRTGTARATGECGKRLWISWPDRKRRWAGVLWV